MTFWYICPSNWKRVLKDLDTSTLQLWFVEELKFNFTLIFVMWLNLKF